MAVPHSILFRLTLWSHPQSSPQFYFLKPEFQLPVPTCTSRCVRNATTWYRPSVQFFLCSACCSYQWLCSTSESQLTFLSVPADLLAGEGASQGADPQGADTFPLSQLPPKGIGYIQQPLTTTTLFLLSSCQVLHMLSLPVRYISSIYTYILIIRMTFRCLPLKLYAHKWIPFKSPVTLVKVKDQKYSITWVTFYIQTT